MAGDRLATAVSVAKELGLEIYAWLEYGTQACYGSLNGFATTAASKVCVHVCKAEVHVVHK